MTASKPMISSTLYTTNPHNKLKFRLFQIIDNWFLNKNGTWKYKFPAIGKQEIYFWDNTLIAHTSTLKQILRVYLHGFLVDNIYVVFGDQVFQQSELWSLIDRTSSIYVNVWLKDKVDFCYYLVIVSEQIPSQ
jgi:hypothetical protein